VDGGSRGGHDGTVVRQLERRSPSEFPRSSAVRVLPWQGQFVTIYNLKTGEEQARLFVASK